MMRRNQMSEWKLENIPTKVNGWTYAQPFGEGLVYRKDGLMAIIDCSEKEDGRKWVHVSISRRKQVPSYDDLVDAKESFIGRDRYAYFVFAPSDKHVNIHANCLHIWGLVYSSDGKVLPEFSDILEGVGRSI
jgi:hypothetical protein